MQVQEWLGHDLAPTTLGWQEREDGLVPLQGFGDICPKEIAGELKCSCKTGCVSAKCSCVKNKFECSIACKCGHGCQNHKNDTSTPDDLETFSSDSEYDSD